jgi:DMSO/TMAO reductase YedYZ molybdopterin-dependent catalytic subunit
MNTPTPNQSGEPAWLHSHVHEPNPAPPVANPALLLTRAEDGPAARTIATVTVADLAQLPQQSVDDCYIVSTGHGTSGPFQFEGAALRDLLAAYGVDTWSYVDVVSADGFGTRIQSSEVNIAAARPILLALACDGKPLTRAQGLVRLIVPDESGDALRQVKWVARIEVH